MTRNLNALHKALGMKPRVSATPTPPAWPSYTGVSQYVGTSPSGKVTVFVDPTLGAEGLANAKALVTDADRLVQFTDATFASTGGATQVIVFALFGVTDGTGGADHASCDYATGGAIEVDASFGSPSRVSALFEAELCECSMGGSLCQTSTGEGLSRWMAIAVSNNALADYASAPVWFQDGMPDYVNQTDPTDQNYDSTGCTMAFLSWLQSQGVTLARIAPAMVAAGANGTLAQLYNTLVGAPASEAWPSFQAAINALPSGVTSDDPFGGTQPAPPPPPPPQPPPQPPPPPPTPPPTTNWSGTITVVEGLISSITTSEKK